MADFKMPDVGEGLTEGDIVAWHVKEGDTVAINDVLVEVETAKSIVELPSPFAGVVRKIHFPEGETVEVGAAIISIGDSTEASAAATDVPDPVPAAAASAGQGEPAPVDGAPAVVGDQATGASPVEPASVPATTVESEVEERHIVLVGYGPTKAKVARRPRRTSTPRPAPFTYNNPLERPYATPPVRKMARELGLDLRGVSASGARGQVTRADLQTLAARSIANVPPAAAEPNETRIPIKGVRKHTAAAMVASAFTAPHVTEWVTVDVTRSLKLLDRMRADKSLADVRLSPLVLVMRAALVALARHPAANARWDAAAGEIVQLRDVNLGIAAATPRGLIVPNIRAAQTLSTIELAHALTDLIGEARTGKTQPERMKDGTFTITNIGVFGVDGGTPILNPGEAAILCMGQIKRQPWEHKGKVKLRSTTTLALSFDHRLIDGELGSKILSDTARVLENPNLALTW